MGCDGENDSALVPQMVRLGSEGRRERSDGGHSRSSVPQQIRLISSSFFFFLLFDSSG